MISIIIPIYNEEELLKEKFEYFKNLAQQAELIFVNGNSSDKSVSIASKISKVISTQKGRAHQLNIGTAQAQHNILLFLHADTTISPRNISKIYSKLSKSNIIGGCFSQKIEGTNILYPWIAFTGNLRARISHVFYGDQGIFVKKNIFQEIGGFPEVDICEDIYFCKKLKKHGKLCVFPEKIICSPRRWEKQGMFSTFLLNMKITLNILLKKSTTQFSKHYADVR